MKILVTGAAGFIGYHLAKNLVDQGYKVIGLDSINDYYDVNLKYDRLAELGIYKEKITLNNTIDSSIYANFQFTQMNLKDVKELNLLFEKFSFDVVINLAAQAGVRYSISNPLDYIESNVTGFFNILECARHYSIKHLIYASSSSVYGINSDVPFKESLNTNHPVSLYAATKKSNELMAYTYSHLYGIPMTGLRFFTVYGPWGRPEMAPVLFAKAITNNQPIKVFNYGNLSRDFTYIDDIILGVDKVLKLPVPTPSLTNPSSPPYRIFNIGNNSPVKLLYFIELIEKALGKEAIKELLPMQQGDVYETYADITALKEFSGYEPVTTIESGVAQFVKWYKEYYG